MTSESLNDLTHTVEIVLFQHFSNCFAGTDFKDDPKKQKYIDAAKEVMRYVTKHDFASEISDNEAAIEMLDEAWNIANSAYEYGCECGTPDGELRCKHCNIGIKADNLKHKAIELLRTTPEPVSVSLEKCTKAVNSVPINRSVSISDCQDMAKAVLDAAGVKYVG